MDLAQLEGNGQVPAGVAESDRGGDVQGALAPALPPNPGPPAGRGGMDPVDELPEQKVHLDRVPHVWGVTGAAQQGHLSGRGRADADPAPGGNDPVISP